MNRISNFTEVKEYPIYDGIEPFDKYLYRLKMYTITANKDKYKIIIDFLNIWLAHVDMKLNKLLDFKNMTEKKLPPESVNNEIMKSHSKKITKALNLKFKYDKNINYDTKEMIAFVRLMLKSIDYHIIGSSRNDNMYYKIVET